MITLPRVTEILKILSDDYADVPQEALQRAQERVTALHGLCCQHLASMMELCPKPAEIDAEYVAGYLGFLEWVEARDVRPHLVETDSVNEEDGYKGTPDCLVQYGDDPTLILPDFKFVATILRKNHLQVNAYRKMKAYREAKKGVLIHIDPYTGKWQEIQVLQNPRDWIAFKSAINIYHWRQA